MEKLGNRWGASRQLESLSFRITEDEVREAFKQCFESLAWKITSRGGPGGEWDGKYVNAIPTKIEIRVDADSDFRILVLICSGDDSSMEMFR